MILSNTETGNQICLDLKIMCEGFKEKQNAEFFKKKK